MSASLRRHGAVEYSTSMLAQPLAVARVQEVVRDSPWRSVLRGRSAGVGVSAAARAQGPVASAHATARWTVAEPDCPHHGDSWEQARKAEPEAPGSGARRVEPRGPLPRLPS